MPFRIKASGLHLLCSACALTLVLGCLYLGWYRWPGWYLSGAPHVTFIMIPVDLALGPLLTLLIASPRKPRRELARDIAMIVTVQLGALVYGTITLWQGRPLYYAYSVDRLELVQASDLSSSEIDLARERNPDLAPSWDSTPRWVWAPLPQDRAESAKIVTGSIFGGADVIQMPRYFKPWEDGTAELRKRLKSLDSLKIFSKNEKRVLRTKMLHRGFSPNLPITTFMTGPAGTLLVVVNPATLAIRAMLRAR